MGIAGHFRGEDLREFFEALWPGFVEPGMLTFWFAPSTVSQHVPLTELGKLDAESLAELHQLNSPQSELGSKPRSRGPKTGVPQNVYFGLGLRKPGLNNDEQGARADVTTLPAFAIDIDIGTSGAAHKAKNLPETPEEAFRIFAGLPDPTAVVDTGNGLHVYWAFRQPLMVSRHVSQVEALYESFWAPLGARAKELGWQLDKTTTVQRVWRVPGFQNFKSGVKDVRTVHLDAGARYDVQTLLASFPGAAAQNRTPGPLPPAAAPPSEAGAALPGLLAATAIVPPDVTPPPLERHGAADIGEVVKILENLRKPDRRALMAKVLAGESFAAAGDRDNAMQRVCSILGWSGPEVPTEDLIFLLRPSLTVWATEPGAKLDLDDELDKARVKIDAAKRDWSRKARRAYDLLRRVLGRQSGAGSDATPEEDPEDDAEAGADDFLLRHSIIQFRNAYHVFDFERGVYTGAKIKDELPGVLRDCFAESPIDLMYENSKGEWKKKKVPALLEEYGTVADDLVYDLTIQDPHYDLATRTFFDAAAPVRALEPRFDGQIDQWLRLLAGQHADQVLDWIATVTNLEHQTCALYLAGKKGVGKGLLAAGLARLWRDGGPTELSQVIGSFNADIARCPLVFLDEGLPKKHGDVSTQLRALIGTSTRTLARKHLPNVDLRGAIRLLIGANNDNVLAMGDESMSLDDLEAIAGRFLHVPASPAAATWLEEHKRSDPSLTDRWVENALLARHALWLRENRQVDRSTRFLVEGKVEKMHRKLIMQGSVTRLVFEWIVRFILAPSRLYQSYRTQATEPRARVGDGQLFVNTQAVVDCWKLYMREDGQRVPPLPRVGEALRLISEGEVRYPGPSGPRYHKISVDLVREWSSENQLGEDDQFAHALARPLEATGPGPTVGTSAAQEAAAS